MNGLIDLGFHTKKVKPILLHLFYFVFMLHIPKPFFI